MRAPLAVAAALLLAAPAAGAVKPEPGAADPRVRVIAYEPEQVYELTGTLHYALTLEFGPGERIENVAIGDALGWQVTPNRRADLLFLKPLATPARTNMAVITNRRRYSFALDARATGRGGPPIYAVRFLYPEPAQAVVIPPPPREPPRDLNHAYSYSGASAGLPARVFDDGRATYFAFAEGTDVPAIYVTDAQRREAVANVAWRDGFLVVDQLAPGFALRRGPDVTWVVNDAFRAPPGGALPPAAKPKGHR